MMDMNCDDNRDRKKCIMNADDWEKKNNDNHNMVEEKQEVSKVLTYLYSIQLSVIFGMQA